MSLARSKSAPQPLQGLHALQSFTPLSKQQRQVQIQDDADPAVDYTASAGLATGFIAAAAEYLSPLEALSPGAREEGENPFNLATFFETRPGSSNGERTWWSSESSDFVAESALYEVGDGIERVGGSGAGSSEPGLGPRRPSGAQRSLSMSALDEYASQVISTEDKFGILSLARIPSLFSRVKATILEENEDEDEDDEPDPEDLRTPTSLNVEQPFDDESLHAALCGLRRAAYETDAVLPKEPPSFGLFSPSVTDGEMNIEYTRIMRAAATSTAIVF